MMSLNELTDFMSKTFLHRHFTYQEHSTIAPVIEELVVYSKMLGFDPKEVKLNQAVTLLKFGNTFQVKDPQYWRTAKRLTENALKTHKALDIDTLFGVVTYLKQFGMLTNPVLRQVSTHIDNMQAMTPNQLSLFAMILTSEEMKGAIDVTPAHLEKLENTLVSRLPEFDASEFSMICNTVRDSSSNLDQFLVQAESQVKQWLQQNQLLPQELTNIIVAYQ
jgi:hypothetical protein